MPVSISGMTLQAPNSTINLSGNRAGQRPTIVAPRFIRSGLSSIDPWPVPAGARSATKMSPAATMPPSSRASLKCKRAASERSRNAPRFFGRAS